MVVTLINVRQRSANDVQCAVERLVSGLPRVTIPFWAPSGPRRRYLLAPESACGRPDKDHQIDMPDLDVPDANRKDSQQPDQTGNEVGHDHDPICGYCDRRRFPQRERGSRQAGFQPKKPWKGWWLEPVCCVRYQMIAKPTIWLPSMEMGLTGPDGKEPAFPMGIWFSGEFEFGFH